jgi:hypothetical protein
VHGLRRWYSDAVPCLHITRCNSGTQELID